MLGTIMVQSITFFRTMEAAEAMAEANGGRVEGFIAAPAKGRPDRFVVEVVDTDDGFHLGYL